MVALADGKPQTMGLKTIIKHYVNHQKEIVTRRTKRELAIAEKRFHIVEGFIKAINILDDVIKTIRESKSKKDAGINLMDKFGFTEAQAEAILELMLYRLTGLEIKVFQKEYDELTKTIKRLKNILDKEKELLKVIKNELKEISDKYSDDRRTMIIHNDEEGKIDLEELIVVEERHRLCYSARGTYNHRIRHDGPQGMCDRWPEGHQRNHPPQRRRLYD